MELKYIKVYNWIEKTMDFVDINFIFKIHTFSIQQLIEKPSIREQTTTITKITMKYNKIYS